MSQGNPARKYTRRWRILCDNGVLVTYPMKRFDADEVAKWCDRTFPECGPHVIESREQRTWAERKAAQ